MTPIPFTDITDKLEKAAKNGTRVSLPPELARALIESPAYSILLAQRQKETIASWGENQPGRMPSASNSDLTGSNTERNATTGLSAGTIPPLVHDAAGKLAWEVAQDLARQRQRGRH